MALMRAACWVKRTQLNAVIFPCCVPSDDAHDSVAELSGRHTCFFNSICHSVNEISCAAEP